MTPLDNLTFNHLGDAVRVAFEWMAKRSREQTIDDPAEYWVETLVSMLQGASLVWPPIVQFDQPMLPFQSPHRITTELYSVGGGGIAGGPTIDVLLQVWFETESMNTAFGVPLLMRRIPAFGPVPRAVWDELRDTARVLNRVTASGRLLLIGHPAPFDMPPPAYIGTTDVYALSTILAAGMTDPPRGMAGRFLEHFAHDLVSGWIGDPALAGGGTSGNVLEFLSLFDVARVFRIRIRKDLA